MSARSDAVREWADNVSLSGEFRNALKALLDEHETMENRLVYLDPPKTETRMGAYTSYDIAHQWPSGGAS